MAVLARLLAATRACSRLSHPKTLNPPRWWAPRPPCSLYHGASEQRVCSTAPNVQRARMAPDLMTYSLCPALLSGLLGFGALGIAYADADETATEPSLSKESRENYSYLEETAIKERQRILELLRSKRMQFGSHPPFTIAVKGQKITLKFQVPPACEVAQMVASLVSQLGVKIDERGGGSDMLLRAWDSSVAWQLTFRPLEKRSELEGKHAQSNVNADGGDLCVLIFGSLISSDKAEIEFIKGGSLTPKELEAFVSLLQIAGAKSGRSKTLEGKPSEGTTQAPADKTISKLESMGIRIYGVGEPPGQSYSEISWENVAGYHQQKREIEDTVLMALHCPEVYDDIARGTRRKFESNRPRAVLFEGPPGTGKTSCARVIANQAGIPLLYVPLESVMSKYYGESERLLGTVFSLAKEISSGAIIFLDEVDALAVARDSEIHEATRRVLSVLLRQIDGFEQDKEVVVIAATNRKQDLDPALISRFDSMITFDLPDEQNRQEIIAQYAKHLTKAELIELAQATEEMSGRDIRDVCQLAERSWASKLIRGQVISNGEQVSLPPLQEYVESAKNRKKALLSIVEHRDQDARPRSNKPQLGFMLMDMHV